MSRTVRTIKLSIKEILQNLKTYRKHKHNYINCCCFLIDFTWEINTPRNITISSNARITCMTAVLGRLWVGCNNQVVVVNTTTLEIEVGYSVGFSAYELCK